MIETLETYDIDVYSSVSNKQFCLRSNSTKICHQSKRHLKKFSTTSQNLLLKFNGIHLDLNNARIYIFPLDLLEKFTNLQLLYLDSNNLMEIPQELFIKLKNLKWLDLRNNKLISIPLSIKGHEYLETLLLKGNNIKKLPLELGLIPNLKNLQIAHNPIVYPSKEILQLDCLKLINFLKKEWEKKNSNEIIKFKKINKGKIEKKLLTCICYQPSSQKLFKSYAYTKNTKKILIPSSSTYKPNNRYQNSVVNINLQKKMLWMTSAKELLYNRDSELQKSIDKSVLDEWRYGYRISKIHSNILNYSLDCPFALDIENSEKNIIKKMKSSKSKQHCVNFRNFNVNFNELVNSLTKIDVNTSVNVIPHSHKKKLETEIEKLNELQKKLQKFKFYNDSIISLYKGSNNLSKKYSSS